MDIIPLTPSPDEQIRMTAVTAAAALKPGSLRTLNQYTGRIEEYIRTGRDMRR